MIANYRVQAELTAVESTPDGNALVLGTVDGCVSVLAIVDTKKSDMNDYLAQMPSRDEDVRATSFIHALVIFAITRVLPTINQPHRPKSIHFVKTHRNSVLYRKKFF